MKSIEFPQSRVRAGIARGDITPPAGIYHRMCGAATHDRSTGIHRPLTATALYLAPDRQPADTAFIVIAVDHCLLWPAEMSELLTTISEKADLPISRLLVCFSHTHASGLMGRERSNLPGGDLIAPYLKQLATTVSDLAIQARAQQESATILYAEGSCDLATNRDYWDEERKRFVCGFNPTGVADRHLLAGRIRTDDGRLLATIVNYACHPTTLAWENTLISPDYPGAMREVIETTTGAPCVFLQGASGDIGPREGYVGDTAVADQHGRKLGYAVLATLEGLPAPAQHYEYAGPVVSGATLGTWRYVRVSADRSTQIAAWQEAIASVHLDYRSDLQQRDELEAEQRKWMHEEQAAQRAGDLQRAQDARAMAERATRRLVRSGQLPEGSSFPYTAHVWRMGDAIWVALNGEHYNVLQRQLRTAFPTTPLVITTLVNGSHVWYLPDAPSYGKGLYQEEASILAAGSLEKLIATLHSTIAQLSTTP